MEAILFSFATFISTMAGGWFCIRQREKLYLLIGFTAGVVLGVVFFNVMPEIINLTANRGASPTAAMVSLAIGFLVFYILEKFILNRFSIEDPAEGHKKRTPGIGILSALAFALHSFMDGVGIGLGFQVSPVIGILVAIAVMAHDFTDGMNTVAVMLLNRNTIKRTWWFLVIDAFTPILGVLSTMIFRVPDGFMVFYLGFFAGFLLYIGATEMLPEAHSENSSMKTVGLTLLGFAIIFTISRFI